MDGNYNVLTVHLVKTDAISDQDLKSKVRHDLEHKGINHATIEIEHEGEHCEVEF